ncbi:hypothetical protein [Peribacillus alkalitolerans]|uniref:hypothetical protein n=1 Tax=Peribacillus alkalitolerans TaxID=1550385 RepID=UPI0013D1128E|nr:hypothetical protein [Peribacillus alkalitolerans]
MQMLKKYWILGVLFAGLIMFMFLRDNDSKDVFNYYPADPNVSFIEYRTGLSAEKVNNQYLLDWNTFSELDRKAFLRQDVGLLFKNGRLKGALRNWNQNNSILSQEDTIREKDSGLFQTITFHYAEIHPGPSTFSSAQAMSDNSLNVIHSNNEDFQTFSKPFTKQQQEWQQTFSKQQEALYNETLMKAENEFQINRNDYTIIPLTELRTKQDQFLSGFSKARQTEIVGRLWEGLYKNYVLGIRKGDGSVITPLNSTTPLLLLHKNRKELDVITITEDGTPAMLIQAL